MHSLSIYYATATTQGKGEFNIIMKEMACQNQIECPFWVKPSGKMRLFATETLNSSMTTTENSIVKALSPVISHLFYLLLCTACIF